MAIKIDTKVPFELDGERVVSLDARELSKLRDRLHDEKGKGTKKVVEEEDYIAEIKAFVLEKTKVEISDSEAVGIFFHANNVWVEKKVSWLESIETLPTSQNSMDLRSSE